MPTLMRFGESLSSGDVGWRRSPLCRFRQCDKNRQPLFPVEHQTPRSVKIYSSSVFTPFSCYSNFVLRAMVMSRFGDPEKLGEPEKSITPAGAIERPASLAESKSSTSTEQQVNALRKDLRPPRQHCPSSYGGSRSNGFSSPWEYSLPSPPKFKFRNRNRSSKPR